MPITVQINDYTVTSTDNSETSQATVQLNDCLNNLGPNLLAVNSNIKIMDGDDCPDTDCKDGVGTCCTTYTSTPTFDVPSCNGNESDLTFKLNMADYPSYNGDKEVNIVLMADNAVGFRSTITNNMSEGVEFNPPPNTGSLMFPAPENATSKAYTIKNLFTSFHPTRLIIFPNDSYSIYKLGWIPSLPSDKDFEDWISNKYNLYGNCGKFCKQPHLYGRIDVNGQRKAKYNSSFISQAFGNTTIKYINIYDIEKELNLQSCADSMYVPATLAASQNEKNYSVYPGINTTYLKVSASKKNYAKNLGFLPNKFKVVNVIDGSQDLDDATSFTPKWEMLECSILKQTGGINNLSITNLGSNDIGGSNIPFGRFNKNAVVSILLKYDDHIINIRPTSTQVNCGEIKTASANAELKISTDEYKSPLSPGITIPALDNSKITNIYGIIINNVQVEWMYAHGIEKTYDHSSSYVMSLNLTITPNGNIVKDVKACNAVRYSSIGNQTLNIQRFGNGIWAFVAYDSNGKQYKYYQLTPTNGMTKELYYNLFLTPYNYIFSKAMSGSSNIIKEKLNVQWTYMQDAIDYLPSAKGKTVGDFVPEKEFLTTCACVCDKDDYT